MARNQLRRPCSEAHLLRLRQRLVADTGLPIRGGLGRITRGLQCQVQSGLWRPRHRGYRWADRRRKQHGCVQRQPRCLPDGPLSGLANATCARNGATP
jgi:hypothetical protein